MCEFAGTKLAEKAPNFLYDFKFETCKSTTSIYSIVNKKQLQSLADRYKTTYDTTLQTYPYWKRTAILEDLQNKVDSNVVNNFINDVIRSAEAENDAVNKQNRTSKISKKSKSAKIPTTNKNNN